MSDSEEYCKLNTFKEKEKREITEFQNSQVTKRALESMYFPLDTLPPSFPVITIDTLDESNVTAGNIFLSPSGSNCITIVDNSGNPIYSFDVKNIVTRWFSNSSIHKLAISGYFESGSFDLFTLFGNGALRPRIVITYSVKR